jgi:hypothetical protein
MKGGRGSDPCDSHLNRGEGRGAGGLAGEVSAVAQLGEVVFQELLLGRLLLSRQLTLLGVRRPQLFKF